ncbi:CCA tRNA nucleotidyltransferase [Paenibacillus sp. UNC499MF]|uniref:CCA tRNA nucleotidyltransferase n=1 Tax=Paenibacillus sp. UNC499MF TaxID=1502751 RepID=UPI0008A06110|nr:CCA tRNA nucleotidyltransferase [Paenibacillus sp. UNC499MF]SEG11440.1 Probable RNA and SrmB-binding site of polymerase A [Paenibacillus sp. UNC499MF]
MEEKNRTMIEEGRRVLEKLRSRRHEAYFVGGFVRDYVLGRPVKDVDIATSAKPEEVMEAFPKTVPTGLQHGTVTVLTGAYSFEVTTFRKETEYEGFRRPAEVEYITDLEEDLKRRDFTMNAMAMDADGSLIDPFEGRSDMDRGVLRCVGEASERFGEDALRMLRCIRFTAEYGLCIEEATWQALLRQAPLLRHIAMERVRAELQRMVGGADPARAAELLLASGLWRHAKTPLALPFAAWGHPHARAVIAHLSSVPAEEDRWAVLLLLIGSQQLDAVRAELRALTFPGEDIARLTRILAMHALLQRDDAEEAAVQPRADAPASAVGCAAARFKLAVLAHGKEAARGWLRAAGLLSAAWRQQAGAGAASPEGSERPVQEALPSANVVESAPALKGEPHDLAASSAGTGRPGQQGLPSANAAESAPALKGEPHDLAASPAGTGRPGQEGLPSATAAESCSALKDEPHDLAASPVKTGRPGQDAPPSTTPAIPDSAPPSRAPGPEEASGHLSTDPETDAAAGEAGLDKLFRFMAGEAVLYLDNGESWIREMPVHGIKDLAVGGTDLMARSGQKAGPWIGETLNMLLERVALGLLENTKEILMTEAFRPTEMRDE